MTRILFAALLLGIAVNGCKKEEDDTFHGPVWILFVNVYDGSRPDRLLQQCAHVKWKYQGDENDRDVGCRDANGYVKVWEPISEDVRIIYHVECEGYSPTGDALAIFSYAQVDTVEGRENPEVTQSVEITLYPN